MLIEVSALEGAYRFQLSEEKGFLPRFRPVTALPQAFQKLELVARELPVRLADQKGTRAWSIPMDHVSGNPEPASHGCATATGRGSDRC